MKPLVSILIPAYNTEKTIADTIQSAIAQTWPRKEIIVVDDGSTDRTVEVAQRFGSKVTVVSTTNQGAAAARNHAMRLSQGDYIQWLDADDILVPDKIQRQIAALQEADSKRVLLSSPWAPFYYRSRHARFVPNSLCQDLSPVEWLLRKLGGNVHMQTATWLTSREVAEAAGKWDTSLVCDDDGEYFCRVLLASEGTRFVPGTGVFYRVTTRKRLSYIGDSDEKKESQFRSMKLHIKYIRSLEESDRVRTACVTYLRTWYLSFYPERQDIVAEMQNMAAQLQGHLEPPRLGWKYAWMKPVFGWKAAKSAQATLPHLKLACVKQCDRALYNLEGRRAGANPSVDGESPNSVAAVSETKEAATSRESSVGQTASADVDSEETGENRPGLSGLMASVGGVNGIAVSLLTGGSDRPYVFGLTTALRAKGIVLDLIGSDELDTPEFQSRPGLTLLNLRGSQLTDASFLRKTTRVLIYYVRLILYAASAKPKIFHILWNNRFEHFDRTLLMLWYRLLGKRIVLTVHNVNTAKRDCRDSRLNRLTLRVQYRLAHHIFAHTEKMKFELIDQFDVQSARVTVIPFGINNAVPKTSLSAAGARQRLGIREDDKVILFFGRITPYKGIEYLISAFRQFRVKDEKCRLVIAGRVDRCEEYWSAIRKGIFREVQSGEILLRDEFVPDDETEVYFKAADALVLPYKDIYQSGVLFLGQSFGLPVLAADVGSLKDDVVEGETGCVFNTEDSADLARAIEQYFASELYCELSSRRAKIVDLATRRHSWEVVGQMTVNVYAALMRSVFPGKADHSDVASASLDVKSPS